MKKVLSGFIISCVVLSFCVFAVDKVLAETIVEDYAFCTAIENLEPVDKATSFPKEVERVYLWITMKSDELPQNIKHVWSYNGEQMAEVPLTIKYPKHRTYSSKTIMPEWEGNWTVDIVKEDGTSIKKLNFVIGQGSQISEEGSVKPGLPQKPAEKCEDEPEAEESQEGETTPAGTE